MAMNDNTIWLAILGLTAITVLSRSLVLLAGSRITIPDRVQHALRYAPAAALVALIVPELFAVDGTLSAASLDPMSNPKLLAGVATGIVFFYSRHMLLTITAGMTVYTLLRIVAQ
jgi:branched-subunit amino acid transport protein